MNLSFCKGMKNQKNSQSFFADDDNNSFFFHTFACVSKTACHYDINHYLFTVQ